MKDEKEYTWAHVAMAVFISPFLLVPLLILMLPLSLGYSWMQMHVWNWFAVPYLHAPRLTLWMAYGLGCLLSLTRAMGNKDTRKAPEYAGAVVSHLWYGVIMFGVAAVVHFWILK